MMARHWSRSFLILTKFKTRKRVTMKPVRVALWDDLEDRKPAGALVANVDLVIIRYEDKVSVLYGRCLHRGALLEDGHVDGDNLICGVHNWDFRIDTGVSEYDNSEALNKFTSWIENGEVFVDEEEVAAWHVGNPQPYNCLLYTSPSPRD